MMKKYLQIITLAIVSGIMNLYAQPGNVSNKDMLLSDWKLVSSVLETKSGKEISTGNYSQVNWYDAKVPTTVLRTLVKHGVYPDPHLDMNNYKIPDVSDEFNAKYDLAKYSYLPGKQNPWKDPYWFRTEFKVPSQYDGKQVWLHFDGINYRAELWVNGAKIADSVEMAGMFQRFRFNITNNIKRNETNYVAVKIIQLDHPSIPGAQLKPLGEVRRANHDIWKDLTLKMNEGYDCSQPVRDRNIGLYQDVYLTFTDNVDIINPYIITDLPLPDTTVANLTVFATLKNTSDKPQTGIVKGKIDLLNEIDMVTYIKKMPGKMNTVTFEKEVTVPAYDTVTVALSYKDIAQLAIKNPYLWYPNGYGEQYLHNLELTFESNGKVSVKKNTLFGIRKVTSKIKELNGQYGRVFSINGKRIYCKGGWVQPDMLLDMSKERMYKEARLLANANVNIIGSEDMPAMPDTWVESLDKYGLMWWEIFYQCWTTEPGTTNALNPHDHNLAVKNQLDIILRQRNSPSLIAWCAENEATPGPDLYFALKEQLKKHDQTRTFLASTSVWWDWKKLTPYIAEDMPVGTTDDYQPDYTWLPSADYFKYIDENIQQMFRNELGQPCVPAISTLKKAIFNLGKDKSNPLFPLDSVWAEHGAWDLVEGYAYKAYHNAIKNVYGFNSTDVEEYARTAQYVNADGYRAMYEAANSRMWDITSGVMLWKLNSSSPDVLWQLYDWFLCPNSSYYFSKNALEELHIQMNAHNHLVSVINRYDKKFDNLKIRARVYDTDMKVKWEREEVINMRPDMYQEMFRIPEMAKISRLYFVRLELIDNDDNVISRNVYWQSTKKPDDYSGLSDLDGVKADMSFKSEKIGKEYTIKVKLKNTSSKLSFMNRLAVVRKDNNEEVLPTIWQDNYVTLFPGEERVIEAKISEQDLGGAGFSVIVDNNR
jgi:exo-1,4-beta-D-glucosaminidase